jgi:hypothetical protein
LDSTTFPSRLKESCGQDDTRDAAAAATGDDADTPPVAATREGSGDDTPPAAATHDDSGDDTPATAANRWMCIVFIYIVLHVVF